MTDMDSSGSCQRTFLSQELSVSSSISSASESNNGMRNVDSKHDENDISADTDINASSSFIPSNIFTQMNNTEPPDNVAIDLSMESIDITNHPNVVVPTDHNDMSIVKSKELSSEEKMGETQAEPSLSFNKNHPMGRKQVLEEGMDESNTIMEETTGQLWRASLEPKEDITNDIQELNYEDELSDNDLNEKRNENLKDFDSEAMKNQEVLEPLEKEQDDEHNLINKELQDKDTSTNSTNISGKEEFEEPSSDEMIDDFVSESLRQAIDETSETNNIYEYIEGLVGNVGYPETEEAVKEMTEQQSPSSIKQNKQQHIATGRSLEEKEETENDENTTTSHTIEEKEEVENDENISETENREDSWEQGVDQVKSVCSASQNSVEDEDMSDKEEDASKPRLHFSYRQQNYATKGVKHPSHLNEESSDDTDDQTMKSLGSLSSSLKPVSTSNSCVSKASPQPPSIPQRPAPAPAPTPIPTRTKQPPPTQTIWNLKEKQAPLLSQTKACSSVYVKSAFADPKAPHTLKQRKRRAEWIKRKNALDITRGHLLKKLYMDGNFKEKCILFNRMFLKEEVSIINDKLRPIYRIATQLRQLEEHRTEKVQILEVCLVRMFKAKDTTPADLLAFQDTRPPPNSTQPWEWEEQTVTVRLHTNNEVHTVGMRRVKAIGEKHCGKGKRKRRKTDMLSPSIPMKNSNYGNARNEKPNVGIGTLPWVLPTSMRKSGDAPVTQEEEDQSDAGMKSVSQEVSEEMYKRCMGS